MDSSEASEIIKTYQTIFSYNCVGTSGGVLMIYGWLITLDQEVRLFWKRRITGASALFFLIRYTTLVAYGILAFVSLARVSDSSCARLIRSEASLEIIVYLPWAVFAASRVLALSGMKWTVSAIVLLLSLGPPIINSVTLFGYDVTGANVLTTGCQGEDSTPQQTSIILTAVSRTSLIVADIIVIIVTILATRRRRFSSPLHTTNIRSNLADVILYDGLIYFVTITFFNVLDLVLNVISIVSPYNQTAYITGLSDPLTSVLLSQFLLDLQAADRPRDTTGAAMSSASAGADETLRFASRVMGSLGAPLDPGPGSAAQSTADQGSVLEELCFAPNEEERGGIALAGGTTAASAA